MKQEKPSLIWRMLPRFLESRPNYLEITAILGVAFAVRLLSIDKLWARFSIGVVSVALIVTVYLLACLGQGQLFRYVGWVAPRRWIHWIYGVMAGVLGGGFAVLFAYLTDTNLGRAPESTLAFGLTIGPVLEEVLFRGLVFFAVTITVSSVRALSGIRVFLAILISTFLFAVSHRWSGNFREVVFTLMGILYGVVRWRSRSTAVTTLMHQSYNLVVSLAMTLFPFG